MPIVGVFNNKSSVEPVIEALDALKAREDDSDSFYVCTECGDFHSYDLQELKRNTSLKLRSGNCVACCSCKNKPLLLRKSLKNRLVEDAETEIYNNVDTLNREKIEIEGAYACAYWLRGYEKTCRVVICCI